MTSSCKQVCVGVVVERSEERLRGVLRVGIRKLLVSRWPRIRCICKMEVERARVVHARSGMPSEG
jgi:hypothetical protein